MFEIVLIVFITMSLAEIVKRARLINPDRIPLFVVICAILIVAGYGASNVPVFAADADGSHAAVSGVIIGLVSCGLYSMLKCVINLTQLFCD